MNQKTLKKSLILAILFGLTTGCSEQGGDDKTASLGLAFQVSMPGPAAKLSWKMASTTWPDLCTKINIETQDSSGLTTKVTTDTTVTLATSASVLTFYSDSSCAIPILGLTVIVPQGSSSKIIYLKSSAVGSIIIDASVPGLTSNSLTLNTLAPIADLVLGQIDFLSSTPNAGGVTASTMNYAFNATTDGNKLYVADESNSRILIWNTKNPTQGSSADVVLGQPNFTSNTANNGGITARSLAYAESVFSDGTHLFAADWQNNRVLIWNTIPTTNFQPADVVVGQPDMTSGLVNNGGIGAKTLSGPESVFSDGQKLIVTDTGNNRILIWNTIPTSNFQPANVVVGQPNMLSQAAGFTGSELNSPYFASIQQGRLTVSDFCNHRILIWNTIPSSNGVSANLALGQPDLVSHVNHVSADGLTYPGDIRIDSVGRVYAVDYGSNRLLIWNKIPSTSGAPADVVVGQNIFLTNQIGATASALNSPWGLEVYDNQIWIADYGNSRVLRMSIPY